MEPQLPPVPDLPETVLDRLHRHVARGGGRYEEWRVGARRAGAGPRPEAVFAEKVDPTTAWIVVDHLHRLGAQPDGIDGPEADEVFAYRPDAWRGPKATGVPTLVRHDLEQP